MEFASFIERFFSINVIIIAELEFAHNNIWIFCVLPNSSVKIFRI